MMPDRALLNSSLLTHVFYDKCLIRCGELWRGSWNCYLPTHPCMTPLGEPGLSPCLCLCQESVQAVWRRWVHRPRRMNSLTHRPQTGPTQTKISDHVAGRQRRGLANENVYALEASEKMCLQREKTLVWFSVLEHRKHCSESKNTARVRWSRSGKMLGLTALTETPVRPSRGRRSMRTDTG